MCLLQGRSSSTARVGRAVRRSVSHVLVSTRSSRCWTPGHPHDCYALVFGMAFNIGRAWPTCRLATPLFYSFSRPAPVLPRAWKPTSLYVARPLQQQRYMSKQEWQALHKQKLIQVEQEMREKRKRNQSAAMYAAAVVRLGVPDDS